MVYPRPSPLKLSLSSSHLAHTHMHMHTLLKPRPVPLFLRHSQRKNGRYILMEVMTMAHYPLPEEWIRYIQC